MKTLTTLTLTLTLALSACGGAPAAAPNPEPSPQPQRLAGTVTLYASERGPSDQIDAGAEGVEYSDECTGAGGYGDLQPGTQVTVQNGVGKQVAATGVSGSEYRIADATTGEELDLEDTLGDDAVGDPDLDQYGDWSYVGRCVFEFTVELPRPLADTYSIEVADRGALVYTRDELDAANWSVAFEIGN